MLENQILREEDEITLLLQVSGLRKYFAIQTGLIFSKERGTVMAVDDVDLSVDRGRTLGIVGESGSGKSTLAKCILGIYKPTSGQILFDGKSLVQLKGSESKEIRSRIGAVFQDPFNSLDPRKDVGWIIQEPLRIQKVAKRQREESAEEAMQHVGLSIDQLNKYPHEFSGGQRQRIALARALSSRPDLVIADEPVSSLDVSVQAQIVNLMINLQRSLGLSYIFISHDLAVVRHLSDHIAVMYLGRVVEAAPAAELFKRPSHPYTLLLLSSILVPNPDVARSREFVDLGQEIPSAISLSSGCRFHLRCPYTTPRCRTVAPMKTDLGGDHFVECHLPQSID